MQLRNDSTFSMSSFYNPRALCCKPASYSLIQEAEQEMTNTNLITNIFPPKSLLCYEAQRIQERVVTFAHTYLRQKSLCISLVKKAINKHHLFIDKNLKLASDDHTIEIP